MKGKDFFNNLRETDDNDYDFSIPSTAQTPTTTEDVVKKLAIEKDANNINVTVTLNRELFNKIGSIQMQIQANSNGRVSKSKVISKICEQYLAGDEVE